MRGPLRRRLRSGFLVALLATSFATVGTALTTHVAGRGGLAVRRPDDLEPDEHRDRSRRRVVVHEQRQQLDRPDHDLGHDHELRRPERSRSRPASRPAPTARCGSRTTATTPSAGSARPATSRTYTGPDDRQADRHRGRARRRDVVHELQRLDRADLHRRRHRQLHESHDREPDQHRAGPRRCDVVHELRQQLDRAHHDQRDRHELRRSERRTEQHRGRSRWCDVVHQPQQPLHRSRHHGWPRHALHRDGRGEPVQHHRRSRRRDVVHEQRPPLGRTHLGAGRRLALHQRRHRRPARHHRRSGRRDVVRQRRSRRLHRPRHRRHGAGDDPRPAAHARR